MATRPTHASKQGTEANARPKSTEIFERGRKILVGGVNSPVRAFRAVGGTPLIIERADGRAALGRGRERIYRLRVLVGRADFGACASGRCAAVADQAQRGTSFGMTRRLEMELASRLRRRCHRFERMRFCQFGHGSDHERGAVGARVYGARSDVEIRRRLSRACGQFSGEGGIGAGDAGNFVEPGVPEALAALTSECAV